MVDKGIRRGVIAATDEGGGVPCQTGIPKIEVGDG
jgi:hypothetical protein